MASLQELRPIHGKPIKQNKSVGLILSTAVTGSVLFAVYVGLNRNLVVALVEDIKAVVVTEEVKNEAPPPPLPPDFKPPTVTAIAPEVTINLAAVRTPPAAITVTAPPPPAPPKPVIAAPPPPPPPPPPTRRLSACIDSLAGARQGWDQIYHHDRRHRQRMRCDRAERQASSRRCRLHDGEEALEVQACDTGRQAGGYFATRGCYFRAEMIYRNAASNGLLRHLTA